MDYSKHLHSSSYGSIRWKKFIQDKICKTNDNVKVFYQVIQKNKNSKKTLILANGLGGRLYSWGPIIEEFIKDYKIISWDYRGLFDSETPKNMADLSVNRHALDLKAIIEAEKLSSVVLVGWSMGVQVVLEFTSHFPDVVKKLILINGTHGHALTTGLQPFFRFPFTQSIFHELIEIIYGSSYLQKLFCIIPQNRSLIGLFGKTLGLFWSNPDLPQFTGWFFNDVFHPKNFPHILRMLQELDAHSVYHHLREINHPALIFSGGVDILTPSYQSREMYRKLPNSEYVSYPFSSHFVVLEKSESIVKKIRSFLKK